MKKLFVVVLLILCSCSPQNKVYVQCQYGAPYFYTGETGAKLSEDEEYNKFRFRKDDTPDQFDFDLTGNCMVFYRP